MKIGKAVVVGTLAVSAGVTVAQGTYSTYGNQTYGSDGTTHSTYGNQTYGSDGTTYSTYGNQTYGSDGSSASQYGNQIYTYGR